MNIACLGWGSLIWKPGNLNIRREWFSDGPLLPIEFVRRSKDGRLTLAITKNVRPVRTMWALMATDDLLEAKKSLMLREGISEKKLDTFIGAVTVDEETKDSTELNIKNWALSLKLDAVVWTNLPAKFNDTDGQVPTIEEVISYLRDININTRITAEEYFRKAPKQIDTDYRRRIEVEFGWKYLE